MTGADHARSRVPRELNPEVAAPARAAGNQRRLPSFEPAAIEQHLPRREPGHGYRGGLLVAHAGGLPCDHRGWGGRELSVAAAGGDAEHVVSLYEALGARHLD